MFAPLRVVCRRARPLARPALARSLHSCALLRAAPLSRPPLPKGSEQQNPNLGFEPGMLNVKTYDHHDHPLRPASAYINQVPPTVVNSRVVGCDGGGGQLGHPKVFINLDKSSPEDPTTCGYCGIGFVQRSKIPAGHPLLAGLPPAEEEDDHH